MKLTYLVQRTWHGGGAMGSRFHPRLAAWLDDGLSSGRFRVPNGPDIVLNEFPRLMRESRLLASAAVEPDDLHDFLTALRRQLSFEHDALPGLRRANMQVTPCYSCEPWFVYTPPLAAMRESWRTIGPQLIARAWWLACTD
jgi:hypothetical protein